MSTLTEKRTYTDAEIARALNRCLKADFEVPDKEIRIKVVDGFVTLQGDVDRNSQKMAAEECARKVEGVAGVNNIIAVAVPEIPHEDW